MLTLTPPSQLSADIHLPASKSISNRALIIHALSGGARPDNLSDCDDTRVVIEALEQQPDTIDIGAAGTAMRFMTALVAVGGMGTTERTLTGTDRMKQRPIAPLVDALRYLGADISYAEREGFPPLRIRGKQLEGGEVTMSGGVSSQYISALLLVAPALKRGLTLRLTGDIVSRPYIDLTIGIMQQMGATVEWTDMDTLRVAPGGYQPEAFAIENDWSAASYWYEMVALCGQRDASVTLHGLMDGSLQGDSVVKYIFSLMGVKTAFASKERGRATEVRLSLHPCLLPRLDYDFSGSPDLAQTFVVACCLRDMPFRFTGLKTLRIKETDRMAALHNELLKLGYVIHAEGNDTLLWDGERCEPTLEPIDTYEDHRMAMAFTAAAYRFPGLRIRHPEVVTKSYPAFWDDLRKAGWKVESE